ncbi:hypothetical protein OEIGOIKO_03885 [Streptomyces chrestomyceticus JCM 4735]|uniref:Uncharacterized protein n=1 Tax=Streptomyces chrestomyceticus JCM 4735 TaxID=1306181 RepID=A0A7U9PZA4_9ACTN|nr:hypothetical protein [Streptomyces chrestomyceticus]GCD36130.1 hypothetical protein OEIGOIKO_03885 [Streptomyces chrestomyceticus JCM 4735]
MPGFRGGLGFGAATGDGFGSLGRSPHRHLRMPSRIQAGTTPKSRVKVSTASSVSSQRGRPLDCSWLVPMLNATMTARPTVSQNAQSRRRGASYSRSTALYRRGDGCGGPDGARPVALVMYP